MKHRKITKNVKGKLRGMEGRGETYYISGRIYRDPGLCDLEFRQWFLRDDTKSTANKEKRDKLDFIKIKTFVYQRTQ